MDVESDENDSAELISTSGKLLMRLTEASGSVEILKNGRDMPMSEFWGLDRSTSA